MKLVALLLCFVLAVQGKVLQTREAALWENFKTKHNRAYQNEVENEMRMKIFLENLKMIEDHNEKYEKGMVTYDMEINNFADMLHSEVVETILTRKQEIVEEESVKIAPLPMDKEAPESIDWRTRGAVTSVKAQYSCGACWAFAATGALEGQTFLKTGKLVDLSIQNLIDCAHEGNNGCHGGLEYHAYKYVQNNGGINTAEAYPFEVKTGECRYDSTSEKIGATCDGFVRIPPGEDKLKHAVGTIGPISAGIHGVHSFIFYKSGILAPDDCAPNKLNHSILVVGYGTENGQDYWIVKNSFSDRYGEKGYVRVARNKDNMCGLATDMSYPIVE